MRAGPRRHSARRAAARARAVAALALSLVALLGAGTASALAGPGVDDHAGRRQRRQLISGAQIAGAADTAGTPTPARAPGGPGQTRVAQRPVDPRAAGAGRASTPAPCDYVQVVGGDGSVITLTGPGDQQPAVSRTARRSSPTRARHALPRPSRIERRHVATSVSSVPGTPLEMTVEGGSLLSLAATATPVDGRRPARR